MTKAETTLHAVDITCDGKHIETVTGSGAHGADNAAFAAVHRLQGQSFDYATKHGGWAVSAPYAVREDMRQGTAHFLSRGRAAAYYRSQGYDDASEAVSRKLAEGEIHIGKPATSPGEVLTVDPSEGRYVVTTLKREA